MPALSPSWVSPRRYEIFPGMTSGNLEGQPKIDVEFQNKCSYGSSSSRYFLYCCSMNSQVKLTALTDEFGTKIKRCPQYSNLGRLLVILD